MNALFSLLLISLLACSSSALKREPDFSSASVNSAVDRSQFSGRRLLSFDAACENTKEKLSECISNTPTWSQPRSWTLLALDGCNSDSSDALGLRLDGAVPGLWQEKVDTEWVEGGEIQVVDADNIVLSGVLAVSDNAFRHSRWRVYIKISQVSSTRDAVEQKWSHRSFCCPFERDIPSTAMSSWSLYTQAEGRITNMQDGTVVRVTEATIAANPNAAPVQIGCGAGASNPTMSVTAYFRACTLENCEGLLSLWANLRS